jgi:hypothetical protein
MYSARPFARSASGNTSIEPPRSMASFVPSVSVFVCWPVSGEIAYVISSK